MNIPTLNLNIKTDKPRRLQVFTTPDYTATTTQHTGRRVTFATLCETFRAWDEIGRRMWRRHDPRGVELMIATAALRARWCKCEVMP